MRRVHAYTPAVVVLITCLVVLLVGPRAVRRLEHAHHLQVVHNAMQDLAADDILERLNRARRAVAAIVEPSVVFIDVRPPADVSSETIGTGSGWVYDEQGHIITNYHVVRDDDPGTRSRIRIQFSSGWVSDAILIGTDLATDIAVLRALDGPTLPAQRATGEPVQQGDQVFAFGSPFGFKGSVSTGIVSGTGREAISGGFVSYQNFIQTDAAINRGNSGGPLTDVHGRVVGMSTAIATATPDGASSGVGFAVPLRTIESIADQIISAKPVSKTVMGVKLGHLSNLDRMEEAQRRGFVGRGVRTDIVYPNYPAAEAGLQAGDIITHVDGEPMSSVDVLRSTIASRHPGDIVTLRIWRQHADEDAGGEYLELRITLMLADTDERGEPYIPLEP
ncbi:MAG: trypsin-like peptidase domain-containing protein [Phycisphaerales bacterium]|nr:trypsin-like peptidase domain-containing protein [Phycisphaerales bacterium]